MNKNSKQTKSLDEILRDIWCYAAFGADNRRTYGSDEVYDAHPGLTKKAKQKLEEKIDNIIESVIGEDVEVNLQPGLLQSVQLRQNALKGVQRKRYQKLKEEGL